MNFNWIKTALLAATAMVSLNSFSQDLIARQAPVDRKLKSVDSLALQKTDTVRNNHCIRGLDLYPNWNNEFVQAYGNAIVPESYTFDLTGFCMPTPNTRITDVFGYRPRRRRAHYGLDIKVYVGDKSVRLLMEKYALSRIKVAGIRQIRRYSSRQWFGNRLRTLV